MREAVLTDTTHTIYCTYHTVLQSTHYIYLQYEMQSHTVLMYSAGYKQPQKKFYSACGTKLKRIPQPNAGILASGGLKSARKSVTLSANTDIKSS